MTDITLDTLATASARPARRDIGIKRRYAAERRVWLLGDLRMRSGHGLMSCGNAMAAQVDVMRSSGCRRRRN